MNRQHKPRRLKTGIGCLANWAADASQAEKNLVYEALFAVADGTVRDLYKVLDDVRRNGECFVLVRNDLVVKIGIHPFNTFSVIYIGSAADAPDIGRNAA